MLIGNFSPRETLALLKDKRQQVVTRSEITVDGCIRCLRGAYTGAQRDSLATRLRELQERGLVTPRRYSDRPSRDEYLPTAAGKALGPALAALRVW